MEYEHEKKIRRWVELELFRYGHHFREYDAEVIKEIEEVYAKAKVFDEIVAEFGHYVDTLQSWESIDHKDTQTLLEIIKENMEDK